MRSFLDDLRCARRTLRRHRSAAAVAVLSLALGIGANAVIFAFLNGVALRPLSYPAPDRIVQVWSALTFNKKLFVAFQEQSRSFVALSGWTAHDFTLTGAGEPAELSGAAVSTDHFAVLGVEPALGRAFRPEEAEPGRNEVVILSHGLWRRRFASDREIVGKTVAMGGAGASRRTVVGVMPATHRPLMEGWDVLVPLTIDPTNFADYAGTASVRLIGRLRPGAALVEADREVAALAARLAADQRWISEEEVREAGVVPLQDALFGDARSKLVLLLVAAGLVLLIVCANVANLMLAHGEAGRRESAIRLAVGAPRGRLVRALLAESLVLGIAGGALGMAVVWWTLPILAASLPPGFSPGGEVGLDLRVLAFTLGLSLFSSLLSGLLPAHRATGAHVLGALWKRGAGTARATRAQRLMNAVVTVEVAVAVLLVFGAGLTVKSLLRLHRVDPGFRAEEVLTFRLNPPETQYPEGEHLRAYYRDVIDRVEGMPGVVSVGMINLLPMRAGSIAQQYRAADRPPPEGSPARYANVRSISGGYFQAMGIPLLRGRGFRESDGTDGLRIAIVNETLAERLWPGQDPLGRRLLAASDQPFTVVGVVGDVHQFRLSTGALPEIYFPYSMWSARRMYVAARTTDAPEGLASMLRGAIWTIDAGVPVSQIAPMSDVVRGTTDRPRFIAYLLSALGALAVFLGAVGVYGLMSFAVGRRTREIGIRMALGATPGRMLSSTVTRGLRLAMLGTLVGVAGAMAAAKMLSHLFFLVSPTDPGTVVGVASLFLVVAAAASYVPARRACRVDPLITLRSE